MSTVQVIQVDNPEVEVGDLQTQAIELLVPGPQGPAGGLAFIHLQPTPATTWTINHGLGYRPSVELLNAGSQEIDAEVSHPTVNQTLITLNPATAGQARLV
jgi:hypothetical protein